MRGRLPAWRLALIRKLKAGDHASFGGNRPDADKAEALIWLQTGMNNANAPDFKIVVRPDQRTMKFSYRLCSGACGYSATDSNVIVTITEGADF